MATAQPEDAGARPGGSPAGPVPSSARRYLTPTGAPCPRAVRLDGAVEGGDCVSCGCCLLLGDLVEVPGGRATVVWSVGDGADASAGTGEPGVGPDPGPSPASAAGPDGEEPVAGRQRYLTPTGAPCPRAVRLDGTVEGGDCVSCGCCLLLAGLA